MMPEGFPENDDWVTIFVILILWFGYIVGG